MKQRWDEIKKEEKKHPSGSRLAGRGSRNLPALVEAEKIGNKAAAEGFDWPSIHGAIEKLQEEAEELAQARTNGDQVHIEHELGRLALHCR